MTAAIMVYGAVLGLLLVPAALLADRTAALRRSPRRWMWAGVLIITLALPLMAPWRGGGNGPASVADGGPGSIGGGGRVTWTIVASGMSNGVSALRVVQRAIEPWAAVAWLLASGGVVAVYAAGHVVLARRRRRWTSALVQGHPVLLAPDAGPAVVGLLSPGVLLPEWIVRIDASSVAVILRHEREHIAAKDPWCTHAASLATIVMPWNPVVWWMAARLRLAVEFDCDARVLASRGGGADEVARYGQLLLSIATRQRAAIPFAAPALIESSSSLSRRIAAMCSERGRFGRTKIAAAATGALVLLLAARRAPVPTGIGDRETTSGPVGPDATSDSAPEAPQRTVASPSEKRLAFGSPEVRRPGPGVALPRVLRPVRPVYTPAAMRAKVQGQVELEALIGADGIVNDVRVTKSLDKEFGLDEEAIKAAHQWRFAPAIARGQPVPVAVTLVLDFTIQ